MNRKVRILVIGFSILLGVFLIWFFFFRTPAFTADISAYAKEPIVIVGLEEEEFTVTPEELKDLTCVSKKAITGQSKGNSDEAMGPLLNTFLKKYGKKQENFEKIIFSGKDQYKVTLKQEMLQKYDVILSLARGKEPLGEEQAPLRIYLPGADSAYWARMVGRIEFVKTEAAKEEVGLLAVEEDFVVVLDQAGRTVRIPKKVERIAICYQVANRFVIALGKGEEIVAIGKYDNFLEELVPSLSEAGTVGMGIPDLELLAELDPDLFIHKVTDPDSLQAAEKLGIPTIAIRAETKEDIQEVLTVLGAALGVEERASRLISLYEETIIFAKDLVKEIPKEEQKTAVLMGSELGSVASGVMLQSFMMETAGALNLAEAFSGAEIWPRVGTEQIYEWNPDVIFITNTTKASYTIEKILEDPVFAELEAVKQNRVWLVPCNLESWELPSPASALGVLWMIHKMYPERLSRATLEEKVNEFYSILYGKGLEKKAIF